MVLMEASRGIPNAPYNTHDHTMLCLLVLALAAVTVSAGPNAAGIAFLKENAEKEGVGTVIPFVVLFFLASSSVL